MNESNADELRLLMKSLNADQIIVDDMACRHCDDLCSNILTKPLHMLLSFVCLFVCFLTAQQHTRAIIVPNEYVDNKIDYLKTTFH